MNAQCTPSDPPKCLCLPGYKGDPLHGCEDVDECKDNPCALGSQCINEKGHYKCICPLGTNGDPYSVGCKYLIIFKILKKMFKPKLIYFFHIYSRFRKRSSRVWVFYGRRMCCTVSMC